jgi:RNA-directed DNA polymerase
MKSKPYDIPKRLIYTAWQTVKNAGGGPGIDGVTLQKYEANLSRNLYKLWNRMSSGTYFPQPVKQVGIAKPDGGTRLLGIPTVTDRIAQTAVRLALEPKLDPLFHKSSFGARPNRSAIDAVRECRANCLKREWVLDLDISKFFDTINHGLLLKAVEKHVSAPWQMLYIRRWLTNEIATPEGTRYSPLCGTPQGSAISPLLSNLFLHYGLDAWMTRNLPGVPFERYLDDCIIHLNTKQEAQDALKRIEDRMTEIGLQLHPVKTKIVHCVAKKAISSKQENVTFTFLGYDFRPRQARAFSSGFFTAFTPAVGRKAIKRMSSYVRSLNIPNRTNLTIDEIASLINPFIRGWTNYFKQFRPSEVRRALCPLNRKLLWWAQNKYRLSASKAVDLIQRLQKKNTKLFAHWLSGATHIGR